MPKEYIYSNRVAIDQETGDESLLNPNRIKITWNRDASYVQLATVNPETEDTFEANSGWYVDLERREINQLIRVLRRSRDQAFGRDE